jgi:hypothetical protein
MLKNRFYRFNRWLDKRETLKFILMVVYVLIGFGSIQFGYLIFGTIMISILCFITISRVFIIDGKVKFDRSKKATNDWVNLTIGKTYDVLVDNVSHSDSIFNITNDIGNRGSYQSGRFISLDKHRNNKLKELGI